MSTVTESFKKEIGFPNLQDNEDTLSYFLKFLCIAQEGVEFFIFLPGYQLFQHHFFIYCFFPLSFFFKILFI